MDQYSGRKNDLKRCTTSRQDTKDPKAADITHLLRFPSRCRNFPTSLKKHVIHKEIRHKNDIYVYPLIHKLPPLLFRLPSILNFGKCIYYRAGSLHILSNPDVDSPNLSGHFCLSRHL